MMQDIQEKIMKPVSGYIMLVVLILLILASTGGIIAISILYGGMMIGQTVFGLLLALCCLIIVVSCICLAGLKVVNPNEALVLSLFGKYVGTIYEAGFHYTNPFLSAVYPKKSDEEAMKSLFEETLTKKGGRISLPRRKVSTKISTFVNGNQKVNDALGNPVDVSAIVIWRVVNATRAVINIDNYMEYLSNQTDSTIRNIARLYPYDDVDDSSCAEDAEMTLRGSANKIAEEMQEGLQKRVADAGIEIIDVRLNQIAYAPEIAAAMLQRQQATAIIAARRKIVEGAVSMVEMALDRLKTDGVVDLDDERRAQMVGNLMVVLCSNREANPVVNAGSIY